MIQTYQTKIKSVHAICEGTIELHLEKPEGYVFTAGQFCQLIAPHCGEDERGNWRWMSLASAPHEEDIILAMRMTMSPFNACVVSSKAGDELQISEPKGVFVLPEDTTIPVVFLVGGIGITPVWSMLKKEAYTQSMRSIRLIYSDRKIATCAYYTEISKLPLSNFTFAMTITQDPTWKGTAARIDETLINFDAIDDSALFYLVGSQRFVQGMRELLDQNSIDAKRIVVEKFKGL